MPKGSYGRADCGGVAAGTSGGEGGGYLPQPGISEGTYYAWKKQFAGLGITELRELRQLWGENTRLKRLVVDLSLDRQICGRSCQKSFEAWPATEAGTLGPANVSDRAAASG
jgi:putative transposase